MTIIGSHAGALNMLVPYSQKSIQFFCPAKSVRNLYGNHSTKNRPSGLAKNPYERMFERKKYVWLVKITTWTSMTSDEVF